MSKSNTNPILNNTTEKETHGQSTKAGGLFFNIYRFITGRSRVVRDESYIELSNNEKAQSKLRMSAGGSVLLQAGDNLTLTTPRHMNVSVKGDEQKVVAGKRRIINKDTKQVQDGTQTKKELEAAENQQKIAAKIQEERLKALDTKGNMVTCPVCNVTHLVDNKSSIVDGFFDYIRRNLPPYFCFPLDIVQFLARTLVSPILSVTRNISLTGNQGCGSPACKGGMVESPVNAIKAADKATATAIKQNEEEINKQSKALGTGGAEVVVKKSDLLYKTGLKKNSVPAYKKKGNHIFGFYFTPGENGKGADLAMRSKGSAPKVIYCPPQRTHGSVMYEVANNFTINAGSPGVNIQTSGRFHTVAGDIILNATEGEAVLGSDNVTTIKGKNIILDANDTSGDTGLAIQSTHTMVHGSFNVRGDAAFKGHLTTDGAISTPYLIVPSMRTESSASASSKFKTEGANWLGAAQAVAAGNLAKDVAFRYLMNGYAGSITGLVSLVMEVYDVIKTSAIIEPIPTGFALGVAFTAWGPAPVVCVPPALGGVWNFTHNHTLAGHDHSHSVTSPKASYWNNRKAWGQERMAGSPIPTPAPVNGDAPAPGPKSKRGGCGGGGLYTKNRNEFYGVPALDPFNGTNYISVPITRTPDGTLIPPPKFSGTIGISGRYIPPTGLFNPETGTTSSPASALCP
jgi:hypothetical protein